MEVCGRYHHWMPILVRVVHRDIFVAWGLTYLRALAARSEGTHVSALSSLRHTWSVASLRV